MNRLTSFLAIISFSLLLSCESRFPTEKRFWTPEDYKKVWWEIYQTPKGEEYPRFSDAETSEVMRKIVDPQNYEAILDDPELGLNYRSEMANEFFEHIKEITRTYMGMDAQDKFIYAEELAALKNFFIGFQITYFRVGNENIANESDDRATIRRNEQTVIGNFNSFLDDLRKEKSYGTYAANLAEGINTHFPKLIETFPDADYSGMLSKAKAIQAKVQTPEIKDALTNLINTLETSQAEAAKD